MDITYSALCSDLKASVEAADQSWHVDTDQNGKDQVLDEHAHKDELTENNWYKLQLLQLYLK